LPQDYKHLTAQLIDVVLPHSESKEESRLVASLEAELFSVSYDQLVAYRGGQRWARTYSALKIPENFKTNTGLVDGKHFMIVCSDDLVAKTLVRAFRSKPRSRISFVGNRDLSAPLQTLRDEGPQLEIDAQVLDVASQHAMVEARNVAELKFGPLDGVFYHYGEYEDVTQFAHLIDTHALIARMSEAQRRLEALTAAIAKRPPQFCAFLSSVVAELGGIGASGACAGYTHFDHLAMKIAHEHDLPWIVIDGEGLFEEELLGGGVSVSGKSHRRNPGVMTLEELVDVLERALALPMPIRILATPMSVPARIEWARRNILRHNRNQPKKTTATASPPACAVDATPNSLPHASTNAVIPATTKALAHLIGELTGVDTAAVTARTVLEDIGWDSLVVLQAVDRIRSDFWVDLPIRSLLEMKTLGQLTALIENRQIEADASTQADATQLVERILDDIQSMTDREVDQALSQELGTSCGTLPW
jgi:acyl carrier protein